MKKLQNDFTTIEQSDKLIALGLSEGSADCYHGACGGHPDYVYVRQSDFDLEDDAIFRLNTNLTPCWSAGRLINIFECCTGVKYNHNSDMSLIDDIFSKMQSFINANIFDFSKLEEL